MRKKSAEKYMNIHDGEQITTMYHNHGGVFRRERNNTTHVKLKYKSSLDKLRYHFSTHILYSEVDKQGA